MKLDPVYCNEDEVKYLKEISIKILETNIGLDSLFETFKIATELSFGLLLIISKRQSALFDLKIKLNFSVVAWPISFNYLSIIIEFWNEQ